MVSQSEVEYIFFLNLKLPNTRCCGRDGQVAWKVESERRNEV